VNRRGRKGDRGRAVDRVATSGGGSDSKRGRVLVDRVLAPRLNDVSIGERDRNASRGADDEQDVVVGRERGTGRDGTRGLAGVVLTGH